MAKQNAASEKTKELTKDTHAAGAKSAEAKGAAEAKKPAESKENGGSKGSTARGKSHTALPGHCFSWECRREADRFNFCKEHYEHFKFGLIKKTGEPVPDYEKKIEHFQAYKAKQAAQKVA